MMSDISTNPKNLSQLTAEIYGNKCPNCLSKTYIKSGKYNGNQRYKCSKCGKHFRDTTGKTIHRLHHKSKIEAYIACMNNGLSLRKTAKEIGISLQTAFRWRHRLLNVVEHTESKREKAKKTLSTYILPYSTKGSKTPDKLPKKTVSIVQQDIAGHITINLVNNSQNRLKLMKELDNCEYDCLPSVYLPRMIKTISRRQVPIEQIPRIERIHLLISNWLKRFRGVASKYLDNYWSWFILTQNVSQKIPSNDRYLYQCL